jgi:hypothetical protein
VKFSRTFEQVVESIKRRVVPTTWCHVDLMARLTIEEMGLAISDTGEIYDPAPAPAREWELPAQRWRPGRKRR